MAERALWNPRTGLHELIVVPADATPEEEARLQEERRRREQVIKRRAYADATQWDAGNEEARAACQGPLPEHERKHGYSVQIGEAVEFVANQLSEGFRLVAEDPQVQAVVDQMTAGTEALSGGEEDDLTTDDLLLDACVAGDVAYEVKWDPVEEAPYLDVWESESVDFDAPYTGTVRKVIRQQQSWETDPQGNDVQVTERAVYQVEVNPATGERECVKRVFWDADDTVRGEEWLGIPVIPWGLLRCRRNLREFRGDSLIEDKAMWAADRYDAVEQLSYLIARYNSHGNLVVVGDGANLQIQNAEKVHKDVADVLTFPGGTNAYSVTLPTDPEMIEHQRKVLSDSIFASFGLVRVEPDTLGGLSGISGYALEILNRKTEGTFRRVRRNWKKDWQRLLNLVLDVTAYKRDATLDAAALEAAGLSEDDVNDPGFVWPEDVVIPTAFWQVDPQQVFPNREIEVRLGTGYIVDDVLVRDDFLAGLVSQREALRQRGFNDDQIGNIMAEQAAETPLPEASLFNGSGTTAGATIGQAGRE